MNEIVNQTTDQNGVTWVRYRNGSIYRDGALMLLVYGDKLSLTLSTETRIAETLERYREWNV
jgi:hypothetical protein